MSAQQKSITKQEFLDGKPFYFQDAKEYTYSFYPDSGSIQTGILKKWCGGIPGSVNEITNDGFRILVLGKHKFCAWAECHPITPLTKQEFLAGKEFNYNGHFKMLNRNPLYYDAKKDQLIDAAAKQEIDLLTINDRDFYLLKTGYGKIIIDFNECQLTEKK